MGPLSVDDHILNVTDLFSDAQDQLRKHPQTPYAFVRLAVHENVVGDIVFAQVAIFAEQFLQVL
jgi:hypothetical protein